MGAGIGLHGQFRQQRKGDAGIGARRMAAEAHARADGGGRGQGEARLDPAVKLRVTVAQIDTAARRQAERAEIERIARAELRSPMPIRPNIIGLGAQSFGMGGGCARDREGEGQSGEEARAHMMILS